jgi:hypothetical protein
MEILSISLKYEYKSTAWFGPTHILCVDENTFNRRENHRLQVRDTVMEIHSGSNSPTGCY